MPEWRDDEDYGNPDVPCTELQWIEKRGFIAWEYTLKVSVSRYLGKKYHLHELMDMKR